MLNIKQLRKDCLKTLHSISDEEFYAWNAAYDKRKALEDAKWDKMTVEERYEQIFASNCGIALDIALSNGSLNGSPKKSVAKTTATAPKTASAKPRTPQVRARNSTKAKEIIEEAAKRAKNTPWGKGKSTETLRAGIGEFAVLNNESETLAEAVGDYFTNGSNAHPFSLKIIEVLKEVL